MDQQNPIFIVAEDDPDDHLLIQDAIEEACPPDVGIQFVWDGAELIDYLRRNPPHDHAAVMILLDLNMPRKDGRSALREIKADAALAQIPVAILTTSNNTADADYCRQYGAVGFFNKPGSMAELRRIVGELYTEYLGRG